VFAFVRLKWRVVPTTNIQRALLPTRTATKRREEIQELCVKFVQSQSRKISLSVTGVKEYSMEVTLNYCLNNVMS